MIKTNSIYTLNKKDPKAIVYNTSFGAACPEKKEKNIQNLVLLKKKLKKKLLRMLEEIIENIITKEDVYCAI